MVVALSFRLEGQFRGENEVSVDIWASEVSPNAQFIGFVRIEESSKLLD